MGNIEAINGTLRGYEWENSRPSMGHAEDINWRIQAIDGKNRGHEWESSTTLMVQFDDIHGKFRGQ